MLLQPAAEAHIVAAVGPKQAPADWGCDSLFQQGGAVVYEKCVAVFAVSYTVDEAAASPSYLNELLGNAPSVAGGEKPFPASVLDMSRLLPEDKSYYTYVGSLVCFCKSLVLNRIQMLRVLASTCSSPGMCHADHSALHRGSTLACVQRPCSNRPTNT